MSEVSTLGLFLLDLGSLVATLEATNLNVKKRQVWLDKKTHRSLRDAAGGIVLAAWSADGPVSWPNLTERHLEKRFGRVRSMFSNSRMSCGDYWRSSAINMHKEVTKWRKNDDKPKHCFDSGRVSPETFVDLVEQSFCAALKFTSMCSSRTEEDLRSLFGMSKSDPNLRASALNDDCEDDEEDGDAGDVHQASPADMLEHIKDSQKLSSPKVEEQEVPECDDDRATVIHEKSRGNRADSKISAATSEVCGELPVPEGSQHAQEAFQQRLKNLTKTTLSAAVAKHENLEAAKTDLWLLLCHLRLSPGGCDSDIIRNHCTTRGSLEVKIPKWQNLVRHQLAVIESQERMPQSRTSRTQGWVQSTEELRKTKMPSLPSTLAMAAGQVVAISVQSTWKVGMVLSVWRVYKKGVGSQLTCREISRGSMHSVRCVVMRSPFDDSPATFMCDSSSVMVVLPLENIGVRLDTEEMKVKRGIDGTKIHLCKATRWEFVKVHWDE